jgi:Trk K+ transport system NAD-binding subunit
VTEILDAENVDHARAAGADEVVETRRLGFSMIAHTARYHHTADSMSRLLLTGSYNPYVGKIPNGIDEVTPYSELLAKLQLTSQGALVIGLYPPGESAVINPARDYPVTPGTHLIYLAETPVLESPT